MDRAGARSTGWASRWATASPSAPCRCAAGIIEEEPDRLSEGFQLGQTVIVAQDVPAAAGLTAPGALYRASTASPLPARAILRRWRRR
jgi:predicted lysophospholipase L1 biosynthesis ABC-type transport system permease subunit